MTNDTMPVGHFLEANDWELQRAWRTFPDPTLRHPDSGEVLQYLGTWLIDGAWVHQFRHRDYPETNTRKYWNLPVSPGWTPAPRIAGQQQHMGLSDPDELPLF